MDFCRLCIKCFELDKRIQQYIMNGNSRDILNEVYAEYLEYWINYFESLLYDKDFDEKPQFFSDKIRKLERAI